MHSSSFPRGNFPCNTSTTDWLRTSLSDDIEISITFISLLNNFVVFYFLGRERAKIYGPFKNIFVSRHQTEKPIFMPTIFLSLFSRLLKYTNPSTLMGAKQWVRALLLLRLFEPSVFYNHRTIQKIYLYHHYLNGHHHQHNSHHTTYLPTPCNKPIGDKLQRGRAIFYCRLITHFFF